MCPEHAETFMELFYSPAHWFFEIFLMLVFDVLIGAVAWPFLKRYWSKHHTHTANCE